MSANRIGSDNGRPQGKKLGIATLTALGVVYGDIGTSPLYAMRECFHGPAAVSLSEANVLGVLSLILWSLLVVICIKYLGIVMRADNHGEGGILALLALATGGTRKKERPWMMVLGLFGAGLLLGDGMITPAISVLSAVEGLHVATPALDSFVLPITLAILFGLFFFQHRGTARIGGVFGPIMLMWFLTLAALGLSALVEQPDVLRAMNPSYAIGFLMLNRWAGFVILGVVFLVVTGGEALYADMGHFGVKPIRLAWFTVVLPSLLINYFGQGALLLSRPEAHTNPFYLMAPSWAKIPLVLLATAATITASQAVITGGFSLARQAVQLGYSPRLNIVQTSSLERGQIYVPSLNWILFVAVVTLVFVFQTSSNLAAAYGMAVTTTMVITTILLYVVAREKWGWSKLSSCIAMGIFLIIDLAFFAANLTKILAGGWIPLAVGALALLLMTTWRQGRLILDRRIKSKMIPVSELLETIEENATPRVPDCAIYLTGHSDGVPSALCHNLDHNKVLHERIGLLHIITEPTPRVRSEKRVEVEEIGEGIFRIFAHYGFMQQPNMTRILTQCEKKGVPFPREATTFFLSRESLRVDSTGKMPLWRKRLFVWMSRNAHDASRHFGVPADRVVEIGVQLEV